MMLQDGQSIRVLHVEDEPAFAEMTAEFLEREDPRFDVEAAANAADALDALASSSVDCVVSDYDMPDRNGIELLEAVREDHPDIPFILFTGKGSEEVASEAIQAGVTDYLQKGGGRSKYTVLANRIENATAQYHAERAVAETKHRYQRLIEESTDVITIVGENGDFEYVSPAAERLLGYSSTELVGKNGFDYIHEDDLENTVNRFETLVTDASSRVSVEFRFDHPDGEWVWLEARGRNLLEDPAIDGLVVSLRDITERREREAELRRERDRASAMFEELGEPVVENRFEDGTAIVENVNGAFEELFGIDEAEIVGDSLDAHIVPSAERETANQLNRRVRAGERMERELERETASGTRTFLFRSVPISVGETTRAYAVYLDITKRKQQAERFRAFIEHSTDLIAVVNPDGTMQYQSPSGERILGYGSEELLTENIFEYVHPEDREEVMGEFQDAIENPELAPITEFRFRHKDGSWRWLEAVGNNQLDNPAIEGVVVNGRDVTERKAYEQRLGTLHDANRDLMGAETKGEIAEIATETATTILDFPMSGVHLYDEGEDALVPVATSSANEEIIGESPTFHPGEGIAWEVFETGEAQLHENVGEASEMYNPETPIRSEILLPLGNHGVFIISSTIAGDFDDFDSGLAQVLAANVEAALDRAERRTELEDRTQELQRQNERLDEFASAVSHDLRNPLNVAQGELEAARAECESEHLEAVAWAHDRMGRLIEDLLALAREGDSVRQTESVALDDVVEQSWRNVPTSDATLRVNGAGRIEADEGRLQQLLENLIRNAVEHAGEDVTMTVGRRDDGGFYVADDGPGIPASEQERVFESGYTTTATGTGFGLAIIREIVHAHNWEVSVTESDGGGARFDVTGVDSLDAETAD